MATAIGMERAQAKSIHLVFSNSNITQSEPRKYLSPFIEWNNSISESTTPAYNGCDIPPRLLRNFVSTFLNYGIFALSSRHGYFCVTEAAYYTKMGANLGRGAITREICQMRRHQWIQDIEQVYSPALSDK